MLREKLSNSTILNCCFGYIWFKFHQLQHALNTMSFKIIHTSSMPPLHRMIIKGFACFISFWNKEQQVTHGRVGSFNYSCTEWRRVVWCIFFSSSSTNACFKEWHISQQLNSSNIALHGLSFSLKTPKVTDSPRFNLLTETSNVTHQMYMKPPNEEEFQTQ